MTWRNHIASIESKVSKNLGILYKARTYPNLNSTKQLYFSFIHSYLSYGNIAKLNTLHRRQNTHHVLFISKTKIHVYQVLLFMHKVKINIIPNVFKYYFAINSNKYNTKNANTTFYKPHLKRNAVNFL